MIDYIWSVIRLATTVLSTDTAQQTNVRSSVLISINVDRRFPHIKPGKHKAIGDHFLALFLVDPTCQQGGGQKSSEQSDASAENNDGRLRCLDISLCPEIIKHAGSAPLDNGYRRRRSWFMRWLSKH